MAKKGKVEVPDWAEKMLKQMGSPKIEDFVSVVKGDLLERRHGLRRDDIISIQLDSRSLRDDDEHIVRGRLLSSGKTSIELLDEDGAHQYIARDVIVKITLICHTRPAYIDDSELLTFERADMKRRNKLHETVEKKTNKSDDSHLWG